METLARLRMSLFACLVALPAQAQPAPSIGRRAWTSTEGFTHVSAARVLSDGRVLVADSRDKRIIVLSAQGRVIDSVGRAGQGPGEFVIPRSLLALPGDTTLVPDLMLRRYLLVGPDLVIARTTPFPPTAGWAPLAKALGASTDIVGPDGLPSPGRPWVSLSRLSLLTGEVRSLARLASASAEPLDAGGQRIMTAPRFAANDGFATAPDGRIAVIRADGYRVEWLSRDGAVIASGPSTPYDEVTVLDEERRGPFGVLVPGPRMKPAFDPEHLHVDPDGLLWVGRHEARGATARRYDVFDARGMRVTTVRMPPGRTLIGFGARAIYLVFTDDDDLQWVERHER